MNTHWTHNVYFEDISGLSQAIIYIFFCIMFVPLLKKHFVAYLCSIVDSVKGYLKGFWFEKGDAK